MQVLVRSLVAAFRNLLVARVDPQLLDRDLAPEDAQRAQERARGVPMAMLVRALRGLTEALSLGRSGGNPRLELETTLLRLILTAEDASLEGVSARVAALEERLAGSPPAAGVERPSSATVSNKPAAAPAGRTNAPSGLSVGKVRAAWPSIRRKVESEYQPLRGPLSGVTVDELNGNAVVLSARNALDADIVRERIGLIEAAATDVLGAATKITLRAGSGNKATGSGPGGVASVTAGDGHDDVDALFNYASERIRER
jgi:DNA polymerase III gamma/tau subunit